MSKKILWTLVVLIAAGCSGGGGDVVGPLPPDAGGHGGPLGAPAYVDVAELFIMESYPVQVEVAVRGNLPTPCHVLREQVETQDFGDEKRVDITLSSEADPETICTQVLEPFEAGISLDLENATDGVYVVYVNGELVGEFSYPG